MFAFLKHNHEDTAPDHCDPTLRDRRYAASAADVASALREIAGTLPRWRFIGYDRATGVVHLEHDTPIIVFTDDIVLRLKPDGHATRVSGGSRSRVGDFDFWVNTRSLRRILGELDKRMEKVGKDEARRVEEGVR